MHGVSESTRLLEAKGAYESSYLQSLNNITQYNSNNSSQIKKSNTSVGRGGNKSKLQMKQAALSDQLKEEGRHSGRPSKEVLSSVLISKAGAAVGTDNVNTVYTAIAEQNPIALVKTSQGTIKIDEPQVRDTQNSSTIKENKHSANVKYALPDDTD